MVEPYAKPLGTPLTAHSNAVTSVWGAVGCPLEAVWFGSLTDERWCGGRVGNAPGLCGVSWRPLCCLLGQGLDSKVCGAF
jgi:hypothetical protein